MPLQRGKSACFVQAARRARRGTRFATAQIGLGRHATSAATARKANIKQSQSRTTRSQHSTRVRAYRKRPFASKGRRIMLAIHTILHPTDFSAPSQYALALACALTRDYGARLIVLHVAEPPPIIYGEGLLAPDPQDLRATAQGQLDRLQVPHADVRAERRLEQGDTIEEILRVAEEVHADLLVLGTHGRTGLERLLMGSVAEQVMRRAACPVLTIKRPLPATAGKSELRAEPART
jgi:nucleotide-binding universal stress UspA family protein